MKLYNTLSRKKEEFIPIEPGKVRMYSCGPTVYDFFHIGNARPFIVFDTLRRYLEYRGLDVTFVQNFTDIDDRMIERSQLAGLSLHDFADKYITEYTTDAIGLGIKPATVQPRATDNIPEIIALIKTLEEKGFAYEMNGDVYYKTRAFEGYGKLSHYNLEELEAGARVDVDDRKHDSVDFALWKAQKPGEPAWESPWGMGRPGWHIECSAMAGRYLGETIDIHSGGLDLIFPHHENEIAQSEAATGKPFARYWLHNGFININNEKMSKSTGPLFRVRDIVAQFPYEVARFFILSAHYRSPINFSEELLGAAQSGLDRIYECRNNLRFLLERLQKEQMQQNQMQQNQLQQNQLQQNQMQQNQMQQKSDGLPQPNTNSNDMGNSKSTTDESIAAYKARFIAALDDDLNTADAISVLFDMVRAFNTVMAEKQVDVSEKKADVSEEKADTSEKEKIHYFTFIQGALNTLMELSSVLGLLQREDEVVDTDLANKVEALIAQRQTARTEKNWAEADRVRNTLKDMGIEIKDTPDGVKWSVMS